MGPAVEYIFPHLQKFYCGSPPNKGNLETWNSLGLNQQVQWFRDNHLWLSSTVCREQRIETKELGNSSEWNFSECNEETAHRTWYYAWSWVSSERQCFQAEDYSSLSDSNNIFWISNNTPFREKEFWNKRTCFKNSAEKVENGGEERRMQRQRTIRKMGRKGEKMERGRNTDARLISSPPIFHDHMLKSQCV